MTALAALSGNRVISGSSDNTLRVWDVETKEIPRTLPARNFETKDSLTVLQGHHDTVRAIVVSNSRVISGSADNTLRVWDVYAGRNISILYGHQGPVTALTALPDGCIVSGSEDKTLRVWDTQTGRIVATVYGDAAFYAVACVDRHLIVAGDGAGNVWFIDLPELPRA